MTFLLEKTPSHLQLRLTTAKAPGPIYVDFLSGAANHRRLYGGGKNQLIARAVGLKKQVDLSVIDLTTGLGKDAFVLATLGCKMICLERSPIIYELLQDGFLRAEKEAWFRELNIKLILAEAKEYLSSLAETAYPDVIYFDPMYPTDRKITMAKKEMRILREVVGEDLDAPEILLMALNYAQKRVVVKRPRLAPTIPGPKPSLVYSGKSSRFDVYLC